MSRRYPIVALALALALTVGLMPSAQAASNNKTIPFKVSYSGYTYVPTYLPISYECAGARIENKSWIKESETCLVTGPGVANLVAGTYTSFPSPVNPDVARILLPWMPTSVTWYSDYYFFCRGGIVSYAKSLTLTFTDNADGTFGMTVEAYFLN